MPGRLALWKPNRSGRRVATLTRTCPAGTGSGFTCRRHRAHRTGPGPDDASPAAVNAPTFRRSVYAPTLRRTARLRSGRHHEWRARAQRRSPCVTHRALGRLSGRSLSCAPLYGKRPTSVPRASSRSGSAIGSAFCSRLLGCAGSCWILTWADRPSRRLGEWWRQSLQAMGRWFETSCAHPGQSAAAAGETAQSAEHWRERRVL
jgi:hypothetical protein